MFHCLVALKSNDGLFMITSNVHELEIRQSRELVPSHRLSTAETDFLIQVSSFITPPVLQTFSFLHKQLKQIVSGYVVVCPVLKHI